MGAAAFLGPALIIDGVTFLLWIPPIVIVGPLIDWLMVSPIAFIGFLLSFKLQKVAIVERLPIKVFLYLVLGATPLSNTLGTAATIVLVWRDDARYNKKMSQKASL